MRLHPCTLIPFLLCACSQEQEEPTATDTPAPEQQCAEQAGAPQTPATVQLPYKNAEDLLQIARNVRIDSPWYTVSYKSFSHATEQIANGVLYAYCNEDESNVQAPELQFECIIKLFSTDYESAQLAWFQSTKPEIRIMILATFCCGMEETLCCFPDFERHIEKCFCDHVKAQREAEWRWVKENKNELRTVISPLIHQACELRKSDYP